MKEARPTAFRHRVMVYPYLTCLLSFNSVLVKVARNVRLQSGLGVWSYRKRTTRRPNPTFPGVGYVCERLPFLFACDCRVRTYGVGYYCGWVLEITTKILTSIYLWLQFVAVVSWSIFKPRFTVLFVTLKSTKPNRFYTFGECYFCRTHFTPPAPHPLPSQVWVEGSGIV